MIVFAIELSGKQHNNFTSLYVFGQDEYKLFKKKEVKK